MSNLASRVDLLEQRLVEWMAKREDIRAAIVVGSRAREDHPADDWADLDVGIVCRRPARYLADQRWLRKLGEPLVAYIDPSGVTVHALFSDGADGGFAFIPLGTVRPALRVIPLARRFPALAKAVPGGAQLDQAVAEATEYYRRGARIILDRDGLARRMLALFPAAPSVVRAPSADEFDVCVSRFWFVAVWMAKHIRRGELWRALRDSGEGELTALLLQMIEWEVRAERGPDLDTWEGGRFIEEWASPDVLAGLRDVLSHYDEEDAWRTLGATMTFFAWLSGRAAELLGRPLDVSVGERCQALVAEIRAAGR